MLGVFFRKDKMMIIGGKVIDGKIGNGMKFRVYTGEEEIAQGEITSLQRDMQNVKEVAE
ncbi:hypothetical protein KAZ93_04615 [Patescibacteria group bacterium]|nr:hypothetical protein [Patescibacteria group bacterium]